MPGFNALIVWCTLVLVGVLVIVLGPGQPDPAGPVASQALPRNTWLKPGVLTLPGYSGRYVVANAGVQKGVALRPKDVADQPMLLQPPAVKLLLTLPVPPATIADGLNAGSKLKLCGKAAAQIASVTVEAIGCDAAATAQACTAIVEWQTGDAAAVAAAVKDQRDDLRLFPDTCK